MKILSSIVFAVFLNASVCSYQKTFKEIKFGEGGGFTGQVIEYRINPNGEVYLHKSLEDGEKKIKIIRKKEMKNIADKLGKLSIGSFQFQHPGNLYYFIETDKGRITWGDPAFPEPLEIKELYGELQKAVNP